MAWEGFEGFYLLGYFLRLQREGNVEDEEEMQVKTSLVGIELRQYQLTKPTNISSVSGKGCALQMY